MKMLYLNAGGKEAANVSTRDQSLLMTRRDAIRRSSIFLPLAFFAGSLIPRTAKASSVIISRTIGGLNQNAVQMSNATWARPVTIPAAWNKIRVGCRCHWTNTGANISSTPTFVFGLCSGTTNQYGDATTTHFVGAATAQAGWTYNAGGGVPNYSVGIGVGGDGVWVGRKRVLTTNTDTAELGTNSGTSYLNCNAAGAGTDRQVFFIDYLKGSPNYTLSMFLIDANNISGDISASDFLLQMSLATPALPNYVYALNTRTLAVNEALDGTLNAVNLSWNRADVLVEICDVAVAVLS